MRATKKAADVGASAAGRNEAYGASSEDSGILPQKEKKMNNEKNSANSGAGFLIRNGRTKEKVYLASVGKDPAYKVILEGDFNPKPIKRKSRKRERDESREEVKPKSNTTARWLPDETQAMYFRSRAEAQKLIDKWLVLRLARAYVVQG